MFNYLRQLTPLPNNVDDETRSERKESMEAIADWINDFIYKRQRGNIRFTSTEDTNDYYLLSNVLYFDDDGLVFFATDHSETEIDRQNMTMSIEEISDEGEVSIEISEKRMTAALLEAKIRAIKWPDLPLDRSGMGTVELVQGHEESLGEFISAARSFIRQGGNISVMINRKKVPVKVPVLEFGIPDDFWGIDLYSDVARQDKIRNSGTMIF